MTRTAPNNPYRPAACTSCSCPVDLTNTKAERIYQRTRLCPTLRAGMARNKHTQRTRNPLGGGLYLPQAGALAAQSPCLCLPLAQHVGIIKNMLAAYPPAVVFLTLGGLC